ncbi:hypothetical protein WMF04_06290 [Sorangium sp. So ce260]|uniref:hypothetical protein n=1 Tax=Sorangium sp. So ce260 TaxID=3133291 RepID=UPI003F5F7B3E
MSFNIRDSKHRMRVTLPGRPVTRRVSPADVETYLTARGYEPHRINHRDWHPDAIYSWWPPRRPPRWPDARPTTIDTPPHVVRGLRECCKSLEQAIETIAQNEGRVPGEVLREIAIMARMAENG